MKSSIRAAAATFVLALSLVHADVAEATLVEPSHAQIAFVMAGTAGMRIEGKTTDFQLVETDKAITVDVPLGNLSTGISLRDKHMREKYLDVAHYPQAELRVTRQALQFPKGATAVADAHGLLTLHGKTNPVTFHYEAAPKGTSYRVHASLHVKTTDYGIEIPSYLGITVKPDVDVTVDFDVQEKNP